jgi:DNA-binding MarR family transcriptional regulator
METNNFGTNDFKEFNGQMDIVGSPAYKENYHSKKDYIRTSFEIEDYLFEHLDGQQFKLMRYILYKCFRSPSYNALWMKETNEEIAERSGISFDTVKKYVSEFEKKGIIKRYKRHRKDKQHIVLMPLKFWGVVNTPSNKG